MPDSPVTFDWDLISLMASGGLSWADPGEDTYPVEAQPRLLSDAPWIDGRAPDNSPSQVRLYGGNVAAIRVMPTTNGTWSRG